MKYETNRPLVAVILAAGIGSRLSPLTDTCPKKLVVRRRVCHLGTDDPKLPELRHISVCSGAGAQGRRNQKVRRKGFSGHLRHLRDQRAVPRDESGYSLMMASASIGASEFIKFDADVVFDVKILRQLVDSDRADILCIDQNILLESEEVKVITDDQLKVLEVGKSVDPELAMGESIGIEKISAETGPHLFAELNAMMESPGHLQDYYEAAYARLIAKGTMFRALDITGLNWTEIDTVEDFEAANLLFGSPVATISRGQQRAIGEAAKRRRLIRNLIRSTPICAPNRQILDDRRQTRQFSRGSLHDGRTDHGQRQKQQ